MLHGMVQDPGIYAVSKGGVQSITSASKDLAEYGIRVNGIQGQLIPVSRSN
jgi:NAD(P)-dependent dehydrogenase (short-subunit alcohol dehydrogenase family)